MSRQEWKALFAAWLGYLMDGFDFVLITLVLTEIADDFHLSTLQATTLVAAAFISRWFGGLMLGAIGDRFGRKPAMIISILLYSLGSLACGFTWGYWPLFTARLFVGLGMAGEYSTSTTYVIESWPVKVRNTASAMLISGYAIGAIIAGQVYRFVVPAWGWRAMFFLGVIPIVLALWMRRGLKESEDWQAATAGAGSAARRDLVSVLYQGRWRVANMLATVALAVSLFLVFTRRAGGFVWPLVGVMVVLFFVFAGQFARRRTPMMMTLMVMVFCAFLYSWPIQALLPTYLKTDLHLDTGTVADMLFYAGFGNVVGCLLAGRLGDLWGTRRAYITMLGVSVVFVLPVFAMGHGQTVPLAVLLFFQQMFAQGVSGLLPKLISGHYRAEERAAGLGFTYNVGALGGAVAPVLGATLSNGHSLGPSLAWLTFALTFVLIVFIATNAPIRIQRLFDRGVAPDGDLTDEPVPADAPVRVRQA